MTRMRGLSSERRAANDSLLASDTVVRYSPIQRRCAVPCRSASDVHRRLTKLGAAVSPGSARKSTSTSMTDWPRGSGGNSSRGSRWEPREPAAAAASIRLTVVSPFAVVVARSLSRRRPSRRIRSVPMISILVIRVPAGAVVEI